MKHFLSISICMLLTSFSFAQTGRLKGIVTDNSKNSLPAVTILIKNTNLGTQTNNAGFFEISNITGGDYILSISSVGFKTKELPFTISQNEVDLKTLTLYEGDEILREVVI